MPPLVPAITGDPTEHRVEIGRLANRCHVLGGQQAAQQIRSAFDAALGTELPRALGRATESLFDGRDDVVRIRHLHVALDLGVAVDSLAERLADRIAGLLRDALVSGTGDVVTWADHDDYVADYLARRLGLAQLPAWPFEDLAALDHLPAERATAEMVRQRPVLLARLVRRGAAAGAADGVVAGWSPATQAALTVTLVLEGDPGTTAELAAAVALVGPYAEPTLDRGPGEPLVAEALRVALRALAASTTPVPVPAVVTAALALLAARPGSAAEATASSPPPPGADPVARAVARARSLVGDLAAPGAPAATSADGEVDASPDRPSAGVPAGASGSTRTSYAGLALLMPSVLGLGALDLLSPTELARAVWQTLLGADRDEVSHDAAIAQLFPVDPRELDGTWVQPDPPPALVDRLCDEARPGYGAAPAGERWSALLLADLACRLPGLQASSADYLRHQFLLRPGTVETAPDRVTVRLDPVPLGVVLRMAGHGSPPQRLPQVGDRWLVLDLPEES